MSELSLISQHGALLILNLLFIEHLSKSQEQTIAMKKICKEKTPYKMKRPDGKRMSLKKRFKRRH